MRSKQNPVGHSSTIEFHFLYRVIADFTNRRPILTRVSQRRNKRKRPVRTVRTVRSSVTQLLTIPTPLPLDLHILEYHIVMLHLFVCLKARLKGNTCFFPPFHALKFPPNRPFSSFPRYLHWTIFPNLTVFCFDVELFST